MTNRFKEIADSLNKYKPHLSGMGGSIGTAELGVFTRNHIDILIESLYLSQDNEDSAVRYYKVCLELAEKRVEAEQLRNDYGSMGVTLAARNSEIEQLRKERDELAVGLILSDGCFTDDDCDILSKARKLAKEIQDGKI